MRVIGLDIGRSRVNVISGDYRDQFRAIVGEYRELKTERFIGHQDIMLQYNGGKWFGGELAALESEYPVQDLRASKIHERTKLLAVMALHRAVRNGDEVIAVTGQPIGDQTPANKEKMKQMLTGEYTATVNSVTKSWRVSRVEVAAEGAAAVWGMDEVPKAMHVIDCGSRTTNYAVMSGRGLFDRLSGTLNMGCETVLNMQPGLFADAITAQLSKRWLQQMGPVLLIGGRAEELKAEFERYYTDVMVPTKPGYANAIGMYRIGVRLHEAAAQKQQQLTN